ncbi:MAG: hypothetical protein Q8P21_01085 [bacterium]|nr:hypothetical protein [bacterium]
MRNKKLLVILGIVVVILSVWGLFTLVSSGIAGIFFTTLILWVLATVTIYVVRQIGITWLIVWFAEQDIWWSPVRMRPAPGHIVMMTKGMEPGGPFDKVLTGYIPYWHYHQEDRRFYKESDSPIKNDPPFKEKFPDGSPELKGRLADAGAAWVGFVRRYYRRPRRWESWDLKKGSVAEYGIVRKETRPEEEHIFYFATTIAVNLETVPTKDNYPAQIKVVENILLIHPEKAEFLAGKWEIRAVAATREQAREYIARKSVDDLKVERNSDNQDDFVDHILFANEGNPETPRSSTARLLPEYGVLIQGPSYVDFDLESGDKDMTAAMRRRMIAEEDVKTAGIRMEETVVKAEAEKKKRKIEAEGTRDARVAEAEGIKVEFAARMSVPEGADLSWAEAVKTAAPKFISLGRDGKSGIMVGVNSEEK